MYEVDSNGYDIVNTRFGKKATIHYNSGNPFVRLSGRGITISMTVARLILLTFDPMGYRSNRIAIHKDGNPLNSNLSNLKWGTRKEQSVLMMKKPEHFKRVQQMGKRSAMLNRDKFSASGIKNLKKHHERTGITQSVKDRIIAEIRKELKQGVSISSVARNYNVSRSFIYNHARL